MCCSDRHPNRKIFNDTVDLFGGAEEKNQKDGIIFLPIDNIHPFSNHPFRLYEGERLEDMVESIKEHGVLTPVIVRENTEGYEMLAGHNRQRAGKLAGLKEIPAVVKKDLTDEDAYVYVIETNVMQRGFVELLPSEKAAVLAERYEKVSSQGKRNDILLEIEKLNGTGMEGTCGHDVHKLKNRDAIGEEYGMTGRNIARYIRVNQLVQPLKNKLDDGNLSLVAAVDLSYLSAEEQEIVSALAEQGNIRLDAKSAKTIRDMAGKISEEKLLENLCGRKRNASGSGKTIKLPADLYAKYFSETKSEDVLKIIEEALSACGLVRQSVILAEQITSINKSRLIRYMGSIKKTEYEGKVKQAIGVQLNL
ncbi:MAG: ParB N-terminal domain-containing protein [Lachnospiraceae bacterium]|nr:ParB N-terminal domain-containing protein [Lachnospiraceae bacterium]